MEESVQGGGPGGLPGPGASGPGGWEGRAAGGLAGPERGADAGAEGAAPGAAPGRRQDEEALTPIRPFEGDAEGGAGEGAWHP